jgi:DNA-binding NarL/FixJ family response regulator
LTILIADDDPDYRRLLRFIVEAADMRVVGEAGDGEEALTLALRALPDVVVTDLVMPNVDGIELTARLHEHLPLTHIVLISSYDQDVYRGLASHRGADAFVSKRVIDSSLVAAIRDVTRRAPGGPGGAPD